MQSDFVFIGMATRASFNGLPIDLYIMQNLIEMTEA